MTSAVDNNYGFTLLEMLVAIAVLFIFMSGMLINQNDFDSTVQLKSLTREAALVYRQAQTYGTAGSRRSGTLQLYGVSVDPSSATSSFHLYREDEAASPNGFSDSDELVEERRLPNRFVISDVCTATSGSPESCGGATSDVTNRLDVYFRRPSLESNFLIGGSSAGSVKRVIIEIQHTPSSSTDHVIIDSTGYISTP